MFVVGVVKMHYSLIKFVVGGMKNIYVDNWESIKDRFEKWWNCDVLDKPLMRIVAAGKPGNIIEVEEPNDPKDKFLNVSNIIKRSRNYFETHHFLADAFPSANINLGPGSMALYLGGEPEFTWNTLWFREKCESPEDFKGLHFNKDNYWWLVHQKMMQEAVELANGEFFINIPDIVENLDILSALRGPQNLCFDLIDNSEAVHEGLKIIDKYYFNYYDGCYKLLKDKDNSSSYTFYNVLGKGRTAKIQCDFCAMISPQMFRDLVQPSLRKQCQNLDYSIYHLDGPDAIKHVPALMEIKELNALQWTCGAGKPDGSCQDWYFIYDQVLAAGKSLWIFIEDGSPEDWERNALRLVKHYGAKGLYLIFPDFPDLYSAQRMAGIFN